MSIAAAAGSGECLLTEMPLCIKDYRDLVMGAMDTATASKLKVNRPMRAWANEELDDRGVNAADVRSEISCCLGRYCCQGGFSSMSS